MHRLTRIVLILLLFPPILAAIAGWVVAPGFLHPWRRELTPDLIREADTSFAVTHSRREDFEVRAPDGALLRGWIVRPPNPNGRWVLLFHGVSDNRVGMIWQSEFLLRAGFSVVMMDARAHGASGGAIATYGWLERNDTKALIDTLMSLENDRYTQEQFSSGKWISTMAAGAKLKGGELFLIPPQMPPPHIFALGESMGAGIALQSAGVDPRIEAVVAEASFATLREASYDYAGLRWSPVLGKTFLAPFSWTLMYRGGKIAKLPVAEVSAEQAVASRSFPVLLICDEKDVTLPCRHTERIFKVATGPKEFWRVPGAYHTAGLGFAPAEFSRRVLEFFSKYSTGSVPSGRRN